MILPPLAYHRVLKLGNFGYDVWGAKRATYIYLKDYAKWDSFIKQNLVSRKTFGPFFRRDLITVQHELTAGHDGWFDEETLRTLEPYFDFKARELWNQQYEKPKPPPLIEPKEGFDSLVSDLWRDYSSGRDLGLTDLGTYNPDSKLPDGEPSDHATSRLDGTIGEPACAFDLGFSPQIGMSNPVANKFFHLMMGKPEINYVICGTSIWSVERGLHTYTNGGHEGHVHTSGHRR